MTARTLHIIRRPNDRTAAEAVAVERESHPVSILLIQDGVFSTLFPGEETYVSAEDAGARRVEPPGRRVSYAEICRLILDAARVVVW
jgi:hypothetical protein